MPRDEVLPQTCSLAVPGFRPAPLADAPTDAAPIASYAAAGVDIDAGERAVELMRPAIAGISHMANQFGAFGAAVPSPGTDMLLVSSADGVGTKLCLARTNEECAGLGRDLVHHCINDILTCGARPLFFLDYLAFAKLDPERAAAIVRGMASACQAHGCALVGGETAEMPGVYLSNAFDVAGFIVGTVEHTSLVDGTRIAAGDALLGLPSAGLHTNGFSLARALLQDKLDAIMPEGQRTIREALLAEHRCYLPQLSPLLDECQVLGLAHITGGGLLGNVPRMLPPGLAARLDPQSWTPPTIFALLAAYGLPPRELYRTFNMGVGMVIACRPDRSARVLERLPSSWAIGSVEEAAGNARVVGLW